MRADGWLWWLRQVQSHKQMGPLVFLRVYSGVMQSRMQLLNTTRGTKERPNKLLQVGAGRLACGSNYQC